MARRTRLPILGLAVIAGVVPASLASAAPEIVELRYTAPVGCPARAVVEAGILERTPNVSLAASARRVFAITIEPIADGFRGTLVVDDIADKELSAQRCADLASALALVTALAIDPTATLEPRSARRTSGWAFEADLGGMVEAGVSPDMMLAGVLEVRASLRGRYQLELAAIAGRDSTRQDEAAARFTWFAARPAACLAAPTGRFTLAACGHAELGAVKARGEQIINQRGLTRLWLAAGAHASARYPLGRRGFAQLQLGGSFPLVRDRYLFAPNVSIHQTPGVTGWGVLGVGLRFP
jgi:hypothetical protein